MFKSSFGVSQQKNLENTVIIIISRDNTTVASWKLGASLEIFLRKTDFLKCNLIKGFYCP